MNLYKMKNIQGTAALMAMIAMLSGCGIDKNPIQFSPEHMATLNSRAEAPVKAPKKTRTAKAKA